MENDTINIQYEKDAEFGFNHSWKLMGVFLEPVKTFRKIRRRRISHIDWIIPLLLLLLVSVAADMLYLTVPSLRFEYIGEKIDQTNGNLKFLQEFGFVNKDIAERELYHMKTTLGRFNEDNVTERVESVLVQNLFRFFLFSGLFWVLFNKVFNRPLKFKHILVVNGLSTYITVLSLMLTAMFSMFSGTYLDGINLSMIFNAEEGSTLNFVLSKADLFIVWFFAVFSVGIGAYLGRVKNIKVPVVVYGVWIIFSGVGYIIKITMGISL